MSTLLRMYTDVVNRGDACSFLQSIRNDENLNFLRNLHKHDDVKIEALLAQIALVPIKKAEVTEDIGIEVFSIDLMGVCVVEPYVYALTGSELSNRLHAAIESNLNSDFRKMQIYINSERGQKFRNKILAKILAKGIEIYDLAKSKDGFEDEARALSNLRIEEMKQRFHHRYSRWVGKANATGSCLSWHGICVHVLKGLTDTGMLKVTA